MELNQTLFNAMFPNYDEFRVPMWSHITEGKNLLMVEVAIPGFKKTDFNLYIEDNTLKLEIIRSNEKDSELIFDIIDSSESNAFDYQHAVAEYDAGILTITVPRSFKERQKIDIKIL